MTLEDLLNADADALDKLNPDELHKYFAQYFPVTRPELARKNLAAPSSNGSRGRAQQMEMPKLSEQQRQVLAKMAEQGLDISFANQPIRRKK